MIANGPRSGIATGFNPGSASNPCSPYDVFGENGEFFGCGQSNNPAQFLRANNLINPGNLTRIAKTVLTPTYTVQQSDGGKVLVFQNAGAVAVTLAQAGTSFVTSGFWFDVSVQGGGTVTITSSVSTINGKTTLVLPSGSGASTVSNDGSNWYAVQGGSTQPPSPVATVISPDDFGAIHDGSSHLLSSRYATLADAQAALWGIPIRYFAFAGD